MYAVTSAQPQCTPHSSCSLGPKSPAFFLFLADPSFCFTSCSLLLCSHWSQATSLIPEPFLGIGHSAAIGLPVPNWNTHLGNHSVNICNSSSKTLSVPGGWGHICLAPCKSPSSRPSICGDQDQQVWQGEPRWLGHVFLGVGAWKRDGPGMLERMRRAGLHPVLRP